MMNIGNPFSYGLRKPGTKIPGNRITVDPSQEDAIKDNAASDPQSMLNWLNATYALTNGHLLGTRTY